MVQPYHALILDCEGTICSISFVKDVLFPFAHKNVDAFLANHSKDEQVLKYIEYMREDYPSLKDFEPGLVEISKDPDQALKDVAKNMRYWIENDKKHTWFKRMQGLIWEEGYKSGQLKSHLFEDVIPAMKYIWQSKIFTYSSGSVLAQQLLLQYSCHGDALPLVAAQFDPAVGPKRDPASYRELVHIVTDDENANSVLYVTDVEEEARAAREAGLRVMIMVRPGNAPLSEAAIRDFPCITNMTGVFTEDMIDSLMQRESTPEVDRLREALLRSKYSPVP